MRTRRKVIYNSIVRTSTCRSRGRSPGRRRGEPSCRGRGGSWHSRESPRRFPRRSTLLVSAAQGSDGSDPHSQALHFREGRELLATMRPITVSPQSRPRWPMCPGGADPAESTEMGGLGRRRVQARLRVQLPLRGEGRALVEPPELTGSRKPLSRVSGTGRTPLRHKSGPGLHMPAWAHLFL